MTKRVGKIFFSVLIIAILSLILCACRDSKDIVIPNAKDGVYVYDMGNNLSQDTINKVNEALVNLEKTTTDEFAVISIESLDGNTIEKYANVVFNELGIGKKEKNNGILLIFSKEDNKVRIEVGKGLEGTITDGTAGEILDDYFVPYRSNGDYDKATIETVNAIVNRLTGKTFFYNPIGNEEKGSEGLTKKQSIIIIIIIIIVSLLLKKGEFISDSGDSSGGFFSGGDSSGGGFGGGSSGGGGASR